MPLASQSPYPIIVYSVANEIDHILVTSPPGVTFGQICNFRDPNLVTFDLCMYLILNEEHFTFHLEQSSRENATPSSGTTPLASYKEVPSPPPPPSENGHCNFFIYITT